MKIAPKKKPVSTTAPSSAAVTSSAVLEPETAPASNKLKVLLVDDHPITRQGMKALVNQQSNLEVVGEADNAPYAIELVSKLQPDLAIVDIALKTTNGIELTKNIKVQAPNLP